jgi:uncharacterized protein YjbI with pentapeptide repeats
VFDQVKQGVHQERRRRAKTRSARLDPFGKGCTHENDGRLFHSLLLAGKGTRPILANSSPKLVLITLYQYTHAWGKSADSIKTRNHNGLKVWGIVAAIEVTFVATEYDRYVQNELKASLVRQRIKQHPYIVTGCMVVFVMFMTFVLLVLLLGWDWTGFNSQESKTTTISTPQGTYRATEVQSAKNLWDWLGLLATLAIPVVVGFGVAWFTTQQGKGSAAQNTDNQRENALQAYIDKMSELLLEKNLRGSAEDDEVRTIARVRTLTVLHGLDAIRKTSVLQFLHESGLVDKNKRIIDLSTANLSSSKLGMVNLSRANLSRANFSTAYLGWANFSETDLSETNLSLANLAGAALSGANLSGIKLWNANLSGADFSGADFSGIALVWADIDEAKLRGVPLSKTYLTSSDWVKCLRANLSGVDLSGANLKDAIGITTEELEKQAASLKGATMPGGSKHL